MTRTADKPQVLLEHHLRVLKLPTFLAEYEKVARESAADGIDHPRYLLRLAELELIERERRLVDLDLPGFSGEPTALPGSLSGALPRTLLG